MTDPDRTSHRAALDGLRDELRDEFLRVAQSELRPASWHRRRPVAVGLAGFALLAGGAAAGIIAGSDGDRGTAPDGPVSGGAVSEVGFASLSELTTKADLIVVGTIQEVEPGGLSGDPEQSPEDPLRMLDTVLSVDETLKGTAPGETLTVATDEILYKAPYTDSPDWREPGVRVVAFLEPGGEDRRYIPMNISQSLYRVEAEDLATIVEPNNVSDEIAAMSLPELRQAVGAGRLGG